ncbi:MAG: prolipoprotein diacylglyceryl transferase, partial [Pontimonas sp.]
LNVNAYALFILLGIVAAVLIVNHRLSSRGAEPWIVVDIALYAVPLGILGGRLFHVITHPADYFFAGADLWRVLYVWEGGLAIFGALLGGAVGAWIGARISGIRFWAFADALAPGLLVAQATGRFGNYFNQELFGAPTDLPWGLEIDPGNPAIPVGLPAETLFHPTFAYEGLWNILGALLIIAATRRLSLQWGKGLAMYLIWYGMGRFSLEFLRLDVAEVIFGLRSNQWAALAAILLGVMIIIVQTKSHPGLEPSVYRPGKEWAPEDEVESEDRYRLGDDSEAESEAVSATTTSGKPASSNR